MTFRSRSTLKWTRNRPQVVGGAFTLSVREGSAATGIQNFCCACELFTGLAFMATETITIKHSEALLATTNGAEYIRNLCAHRGRSFPVEHKEMTGQIELPQPICKLIAAP